MSSEHWQFQTRRKRRRVHRVKRWGGRRLSFLFLNAKYLTSKQCGAMKAIGLERLLQQSKWPDLVGVTEVGNPAGKVDLRDFLGVAISHRYTIVWSQRSTSLSGGAPDPCFKNGGGIALLVNKRLWLRPSELKMDVTEEERAQLDGHLRVWRLDPIPCESSGRVRPRPHAMLRPVVVTVAYIPPVGVGWGNKVRGVIFDTIHATDMAIRQLRQFQDVFALTMAHTNAPDGGCSVEMALESDNRPYTDIRRELDSLPQFQRRASLELTADGRRLLHRCHSKAQGKDTSAVGRKFIASAALAGKVPLSGVMGHRQSTSWTHQVEHCASCSSGNRTQCERVHGADHASGGTRSLACGEMSTSVHDVILVPDYLVWQALTAVNGGRHLLWQCTRRLAWADDAPLDHAVTYGHCFVGAMQVGSLSLHKQVAPSTAANVEKLAPRRYHPSDDLLLRHIELRRVSEFTDNNIFEALQ